MRSYKQYCGVASALDLIGQRWTLLLVRDLLPGPRRFTDLLLPGLTPNVLSDRLKHLSESGLIEQVTLAPPAARRVWQLTEQGHRLKPVVLALGAFGATYLGAPDQRTIRARWMLISLQRHYIPGMAATTVGIRVDEVPYALRITPEELSLQDGWPDAPDLGISGALGPMARLLVRGERDGQGLSFNGDRALADTLVEHLSGPL